MLDTPQMPVELLHLAALKFPIEVSIELRGP
jgi:hypothetical protein